MKTINQIILLGLTGLFAACNSTETIPEIEEHHMVFQAEIVSSKDVVVRADNSGLDETSGYFTEGDVIGFYSESGNLDADGGFSNEPLYCSSKRFVSYDIRVDYNTIKPAASYYPYYDKMDDPDDLGMDIFNADGTVKDILFSANYSIKIADTKGFTGLNGGYEHAGALFNIRLGEGFDAAPNQTVKVRLSYPIKYFKFVPSTKTNYYMTIRWNYDPADENDEEAHWFTLRELTDNNGEKYYSAVLPTYSSDALGLPSIPLTVEYVSLLDNSGEERKLQTGTVVDDQLWWGNRYTYIVKTEGLKPTIYPFSIEPWGQQTIETVNSGIATADDLRNWFTTYNKDRSSSNEELKKYGSYQGTEGMVHGCSTSPVTSIAAA